MTSIPSSHWPSLLVALSTTAFAQTQFQTFQDCGAVGNGTADYTSAVRTCLNNRKPTLCDGVFPITETVTVTLGSGENLFLIGSGHQGCQLVLAPASDGGTTKGRIEVSGWVPSGANPDRFDRTIPQVTIHDVSLVPAVSLTGAGTNVANSALSIVYPSSAGNINAGGWTSSFADLHNVHVMPKNSSSWAKYGIYRTTCRTPTSTESFARARGITFTTRDQLALSLRVMAPLWTPNSARCGPTTTSMAFSWMAHGKVLLSKG